MKLRDKVLAGMRFSDEVEQFLEENAREENAEQRENADRLESAEKEGFTYEGGPEDTPIVSEGTPAYTWSETDDADQSEPWYVGQTGRRSDRPGQLHTLEEYDALLSYPPTEMINGVYYEMCEPTTDHAYVVTRLSLELQNYIDKKKGTCVVLASTVGVQLDSDDRKRPTVVQPDILVICKKDRIKKKRIMGAPDLVIEVLSPSTRRKDSTLKLSKYAETGVREYWLVDSDKEKVAVYHLEDEEMMPVIYGFDGPIPVRIFDGNLKLDFEKLREGLRSFRSDDIEEIEVAE